MKDDRVYLRHIRDAITRIESYVGGGREAFLADNMIQDAVIRNLEVIGEAVKNLSSDLRAQHPDIPWTRIAGMRDVLIHESLRCPHRDGLGSRRESTPRAQAIRR